MSAEVEETVVVGENSKHKTFRHETRWVLVNKDDDVLSAKGDVENQQVADILFSDRPTLKQLQPFAAMLDSDDNEEEEDAELSQDEDEEPPERNAPWDGDPRLGSATSSDPQVSTKNPLAVEATSTGSMLLLPRCVTNRRLLKTPTALKVCAPAGKLGDHVGSRW